MYPGTGTWVPPSNENPAIHIVVSDVLFKNIICQVVDPFSFITVQTKIVKKNYISLNEPLPHLPFVPIKVSTVFLPHISLIFLFIIPV